MNKLAKIIEIGIPINNDETGETSILLRPNEVKLLEKEFKKYSKLQQELQRKDNIINGIKKEINEQLEEYEKGKEEYKKYGNLEDYAKGLRSAYISILDKIKELESK